MTYLPYEPSRSTDLDSTFAGTDWEVLTSDDNDKEVFIDLDLDNDDDD